MKKRIKTLILAGLIAIFGAGLTLGTPAFADEEDKPQSQYGIDTGASTAQGQGMSRQTDLGKVVKNVVNIFLWIVGIVAVVVMIYGGFQYITSSGDATKVTKAKNTILYGVVGLVIAVLAYAIVSFVLGQFGSSNTEEEENSIILLENYEPKSALPNLK